MIMKSIFNYIQIIYNTLIQPFKDMAWNISGKQYKIKKYTWNMLQIKGKM